jgi:hypothetical protein
MQRYLIGDTDEARQRMGEEIISTTAADIRKFADAMANVAAHGRVIVLGSEQAIEAANSEPPGFAERVPGDVSVLQEFLQSTAVEGGSSINISVSRATPTSPTKRRGRRRTAWCCIRRATTTRSNFTTCTVFGRTISEGSRDAESGKNRRKRQRALRAREGAERPLLHVLATVDRDIGAGHERRLVRA